MRKILILTIVSVFLIALVQPALAIGVSPSRIIVNFEPGAEKTYIATALNKGDLPVISGFYVKGDLAEYVTINYEGAVTIAPHSSQSFSYTIKYPDTLEPGQHRTNIGVTETVVRDEEESGGASVGAVAAVEQQFWVDVPYPGKFLAPNVEVSDAAINEQVPIKVTLISKGTLDIVADLLIEVLDPEQRVVDSKTFTAIEIPTAEATEETFYWDGTTEPGLYTARATATFDDEESIGEKKFNVGAILVRITSVRADPIPAGQIGKIEVDVQSLWNDVVPNVVASAEIRNSLSQKVGGATSATTELKKRESRSIVVYWDTAEAPIGKYTAEITVKYADGKTATEFIELEVVEPGSTAAGLGISPLLLGAATFILLIIVLGAWMWKRNTKKAQPRREEQQWNQSEPLSY